MTIRSLAIAVALMGMTAAAPVAALAQAAGGFSATSTMGDLMASAAAKAVLVKYIPEIVNNPQISQAATMTLKDLQQYAADQLPDDKLAKIDAELKALPK